MSQVYYNNATTFTKAKVMAELGRSFAVYYFCMYPES